MNIGVDIDNTITDTIKLLRISAKKFNEENSINCEINKKGYDQYTICKSWSKAECDKFVKDYVIHFIKRVKPKEGASEYIKRLKEEGNKIYIITSRSENLSKNIYEDTKKLLQKNNIEFDILKTSCFSKDKYCVENNIDVLVDDLESNIVPTSKYIKVIIMNGDHNKGIDNANTIRLNTWKEVYECINKMKNV